ncbi:MAG: 4Fe-4S binding protein [Ruminococcus sp.]|nr:4Fe-4S binding protein [Ruminococcus sp.]
METKKALTYLEKEIHSVVVATVDDNGLPITCAIDIMDSDEDGLYFLTAKGKSFCERLKKREYISLTGMKGKDTLSCIAVSVRGRVRETDSARLERLILKNPYMKEIYPTEASRQALVVFQLYEGSGEWFDLSKKPIERSYFTIGSYKEKEQGYEITNECIGCRTCEAVCPQGCIDFNTTPAVILQENCLRCGNCFEACPQKAVVKRG